MSDCSSFGRLTLRTARLVNHSLLFSVTLSLASCRSGGVAQFTPPSRLYVAALPVASAMTLNLTECLQVALEHQPRLSVQRASLAATEDGKRALESFRLASILDPQIPVRRRQARLGVIASAARLDQAEREVVYSVTRTYCTVLYARAQERVAKSVVERLTATHEAAERALKAGARDIAAPDVHRAEVYLRLAETRRTQATQGVKRALAALREAIGLGPEVALDIPAGGLPELEARPEKGDVVAAAQVRRGELIQAAIFAQVTALEVEAQSTSLAMSFQTFAAGSDLHAQQVLQGNHGTEYRPGAVPPEMPTLLVGSRAERIKHARTLQSRAEAMVETTRNLIVLEAEDAFLRWEEASTAARQARAAADAGDKLADELTKDSNAGLKVKVEELVTARVLAAQARSQYNEFLYKQIVALADLERATAGGFCVGLVVPTDSRTQPRPHQEVGTK